MSLEIKMKLIAHGSGAQGMAFYAYEESNLAILLDVRRQNRSQPFKETWRCRWLPDREFATFKELHAAMQGLTLEIIAAEKAKWPVLVHMDDDPSGTSKCWLHTDRPRSHFAVLQQSWYPFDTGHASLCAECAEFVAAGNIDVVKQASEKRAADVAERNSK
jgi:hypothetical protein